MAFALGLHLLESTLVALVVAALAFFLRKSAAARYKLWLVAGLKFVLPAAILSFLGSNLQAVLPSHPLSTGIPPAIARWMALGAYQPPAGKTAALDPLILIWLGGALIAFLLWLPKLWSSLQPLETPSASEQELFFRLKGRLKLGNKVTLKCSDSVSEPVLIGFRQPVVIVPGKLSCSLSRSEFESIILHELAHAKRHDNWTAAVMHAITCLFWFYPLLWWIERRLHLERELACDELVVRLGVKPRDYVAGILKVCRLSVQSSIAGISAVCGSNLKNRMEGIMSHSSDAHRKQTLRVLPAGLLGLIVAVPLVVGFVSSSPIYGQSKAANVRIDKKSTTAATCEFRSAAYPEGAVIQVGNQGEQMCALVLAPAVDHDAAPTYQAMWIPTSNAIRKRSATVIHLRSQGPFWCSPERSSSEDSCSCKSGDAFSEGALVNSVEGAFQLQCKRGAWVQSATLNVRR